ncbi:hypothetical protein cce_4830 [Crocosphaera subtropica ATCC 51142]|uniref:Uncharacterized protein n=1 Tax=Crocosphaera subtropica (strain ATCC 51142 / BH68) TaxID=43989 RepID=B1X217_CROS5|nr:hypothetical protein [Crocosphaera subtropica]ACB54178.1 hypothetical protein cce_4830 [Crocosphaera subtropica ATCC 51142]
MATKQQTLVLADLGGSSKDKLGIDLTNLDSLLETISLLILNRAVLRFIVEIKHEKMAKFMA